MITLSRYSSRLVLLSTATALLFPLFGSVPPAHSETPPGTAIDWSAYRADWLPKNASSAYKLTYSTSGLGGIAATSTGLVLLPPGKAPRGGWPVLSWAHGTQGIADECAPSNSGPYNKDRETEYLDHWLGEGYALVASDYAGLGTPGDHAYLDGESVAHNVVDMVTASHHFGETILPTDKSLSSTWVSLGHSQGAGAAIYTARYASEFGGAGLDYRGAVGTGTPAYVEENIKLLGPDTFTEPGDGHVTAYVTYLLDGLLQAAPEMESTLSEEGKAHLQEGRTECLAQLATTLEGVAMADYFRAPLSSVPGLLDTIDNYLGMPTGGFDKPFLLAHGTADIDVPFETTARYAAELKAAGEPITFVTYPGLNHSQTVLASLPDTTPFIASLFSGN
jgi:pimeloyl-ACP methyl ester carboxylesterase